jgi:hypothetical protein
MAQSDIDRSIKSRILHPIRLRLLDRFSPVGADAAVAKSSPNLKSLGTSTGQVQYTGLAKRRRGMGQFFNKFLAHVPKKLLDFFDI